MAGRQQSQRSMASGILWMIGCLASFIGMAVASRELAANLSIFQILFFRSLVGICVIALFARLARVAMQARHPLDRDFAIGMLLASGITLIQSMFAMFLWVRFLWAVLALMELFSSGVWRFVF